MNWIDLISKEMLDTWGEHLSKKYDVSIIYPGATDTDMLRQSLLNKLGDKLPKFIKKMPKQMLINPEHVGDLIEMILNKHLCPFFRKLRLTACCGLDLDYNNLPSVENDETEENT